jgi:hypothetical protein
VNIKPEDIEIFFLQEIPKEVELAFYREWEEKEPGYLASVGVTPVAQDDIVHTVGFRIADVERIANYAVPPHKTIREVLAEMYSTE